MATGSCSDHLHYRTFFINSSKITTAITYKLTSTNYLLWKAQVIPILRGVQLHGYLDGTTYVLAAKIIVGTNAEAKTTDNPDYQNWVVQDQTILRGLLSSMTEDVLSQLTCCTDTSKQVWDAPIQCSLLNIKGTQFRSVRNSQQQGRAT